LTLDLDWLPTRGDWDELFSLAKQQETNEAFETLRALACSRVDFTVTAKLDRAVQRLLARPDSKPAGYTRVRLALLGSSTLAHLVPGIRVAALRRNLIVEVYEGDYGLYWQELMNPASGLHAFQPNVVLLALDAHHAAAAGDAAQTLDNLRNCWRQARDSFQCAVIQQTVLPVFPPVVGNNEQRFPQSAAAVVQQLNADLRKEADEAGVHLLALDAFAGQEGILNFYEESLWHRSKQEVHPRASNVYGDQVARVLGALYGKSGKCLVLDLDNTLWGGVIGDDGLEGIILGQGSAVGEAYVAFQKYALSLTERGIILAVCSKNDEVNARLPFEKHPEMVLKSNSIACFVANWQDKAGNLRHIAETLNIGLDSLVFADDNPAERHLVRRELPMIAVPELPEDPSYYVSCLARAGYFEAVSVTDDDRQRSSQYIANAAREKLKASATDMASYLAALKMEMLVRPFDDIGLARITQLINKTNQFNLTTRRYVDADVQALIDNPRALTLQLRLRDLHGDNGIISLLIGKVEGSDLVMDTWLMSCRVLGRQVEEATMNLLVDQARARGVKRILGEYRPTAKNGMVKEHYKRLGFTLIEDRSADEATWWLLELADYKPFTTQIQVLEEANATV
jgi:FkbH-like protein